MKCLIRKQFTKRVQSQKYFKNVKINPSKKNNAPNNTHLLFSIFPQIYKEKHESDSIKKIRLFILAAAGNLLCMN